MKNLFWEIPKRTAPFTKLTRRLPIFATPKPRSSFYRAITIFAFPKRKPSRWLKSSSKTAKLSVHYYAAEGHGFTKRENQVDAMHRMIDWFDRYLKNAPSN